MGAGEVNAVLLSGLVLGTLFGLSLFGLGLSLYQSLKDKADKADPPQPTTEVR